MQRNVIIGAALAALVWAAGAVRADTMVWYNSLSQAQTAARQGNKLIMLDMYTDWCGWCKKLDSDVYTAPAVITASKQFISVKMNAEKEGKEAAQKYRVTGFPTILYLDADGAVVGRVGGYLAAPDFVTTMQEALRDQKDFPVLQAAMRTNPNDATSATRLVPMYIRRGDVAAAGGLVPTIEKAVGVANLGALYNDLGEASFDKGNAADAVTWYQKTVKNSRVATEIIKARIGLVNGYMAQRQAMAAQAELQAILNMPEAPADLKDRVRAALKKIQSG